MSFETLKLSLTIVLLWAGLAAGGQTVLYDGQLGSSLTSQGWLFITEPLVNAQSTSTFAGNVTTLNSTFVRAESAGYPSFNHPGVGVLDRTSGFTLSFNIQVLQETHVSTHRAGFSVLVVMDDLRSLELGFWTNQIWAQSDSPLFQHAEGATFNTTSTLTHYDLAILGNGYSLSANDVPLLSGSLRNYSGFGFPYNVPNFIFLGDNTSSASAKVNIARLELTTVPEISTLFSSSILVGAIGIAIHYRRRWT